MSPHSHPVGVPSATPFGSITDVPGVLVGHAERLGDGWQTGCTVVVVRGGATPGVDVRGGGPGTRETDALAPTHLVREIHAVCLTGGSAFGLAAADGVVAALEHEGLGFPIDDAHVVPVVPAAVIFDLGRGGAHQCRPDASFGRAAFEAATVTPSWGSVGAGTGATAGGLQGGVGTASRRVTLPATNEPDRGRAPDGIDDPTHLRTVTVGAVAVVNAAGSPIDPESGLPWERGGARLPFPTPAERAGVAGVLDARATARPLNTTIGVVATSADLTKAEAARLAAVAHDGLARAIRPAHSMFDGDTVFVLATGADPLADVPPRFRGADTRPGLLNLVLEAAADVFAAACTHAVLAATRVGDAPGYGELCPSVLREAQWPR